MYILLGASLAMLIWGWWATTSSVFFGSVLLSIVFLVYVDIETMLTRGSFFETAIRAMPTTECCLLHEVWASPYSVRWTTILFRCLAAMVAFVATIVTWSRRKSFADGRYTLISSIWSAASILWLISCLPMFMCLIQCAAASRYKNVKTKIGSTELILRFRKVYALWLIHDVTLGIFWLYLSVMLFDLADDADDSEWRTIFLSMLSWHIIVVVIHEMFFKQIFTLEPCRTHPRTSSPCCGPRNSGPLWSAVTIASYAGMYAIIIMRLQKGSLMSMGTDSILSPVLFSICQCLFVVSKYYRTLGKSNPTVLEKEPLQSSASGLDF